MKTSILTLVLTLALTSAYSQKNKIKLSNNITTETKDITSFDKIEISEDFQVYVRLSETTEEVKIRANENLHKLINVENKNGKLKISTESYSYSYNSRKKDSAKEVLIALITVKSLSAIEAHEDVIITIDNTVSADHLTIKLTEDCILEADLKVNNLTVEMDEDCILDISGSAKTMEANANEDCEIDGKKFFVDNLEIYLNEDSTAQLNVNGDINLVAKEDSYFSYRGHGKYVSKRLREDSEVGRW